MEKIKQLITIIHTYETADAAFLAQNVQTLLNDLSLYEFLELHSLTHHQDPLLNQIMALPSFIEVLNTRVLEQYRSPDNIPLNKLSVSELYQMQKNPGIMIKKICALPLYNKLLNERALQALPKIKWVNSHTKFLERMARAGFIDYNRIDRINGHCHGIAMMALQAWQLGYIGSFLGLLFEIMAMKPEEFDEGLIGLHRSANLLINESDTLRGFEEGRQKLQFRTNVLALFNSILVYQKSNELAYLFKMPRQPNTTQLLTGISFAHFESTPKESLLDYIISLAHHFSRANIPLSCIVSCNRHALNVNYNPQNLNWILFDSNHLPGEIVKSSVALVNILPSRFYHAKNFPVSPDIHVDIFLRLNDLELGNQALRNTLNDMNTKTKPGSSRLKIYSEAFIVLEDRPVLFLACENNDLAMVYHLIKNGADINQRDEEKRTPLMVAVSQQHIQIVVALLALHAKVNVQDAYQTTPLIYAIASGNISIIELLLRHKANVRHLKIALHDLTTPLIYAIQNNASKEVIALLLQQGALVAHPSSWTKLLLSAGSGYLFFLLLFQNWTLACLPILSISYSYYFLNQLLNDFHYWALNFLASKNDKALLTVVLDYAQQQNEFDKNFILNQSFPK